MAKSTWLLVRLMRQRYERSDNAENGRAQTHTHTHSVSHTLTHTHPYWHINSRAQCLSESSQPIMMLQHFFLCWIKWLRPKVMSASARRCIYAYLWWLKILTLLYCKRMFKHFENFYSILAELGICSFVVLLKSSKTSSRFRLKTNFRFWRIKISYTTSQI